MSRIARFCQSVKLWFRSNQQLVKRLLIGMGVFALVTVVAQLLYPSNRLLPYVKVQNHSVGGKEIAKAAEQIEAGYKNAKITLRTETKTFTKQLAEIGVDIKSKESAEAAADYPIIQRIIPFSSLFIMANRNSTAVAAFDSERLDYFAAQVEKEGFTPAVNASVKVAGSRVNLVPSVSSKSYPSKAVTSTLRTTRFTTDTTVKLKPQTKPAERRDEQVKELLSTAQRAVDAPLSLKLDQETITVQKETIGQWLDFPEDPATKQLILGLKTDVVKQYLESIQGKVYKAPGVTKVQIIDGREVGRTVGQPGRGIAADKTVQLLSEAIKAGKPTTINVPIVDLAPTITYDRQYSNGDAGLAALLSELASKGFGISVMEIGGRSAHANGDKKFVAASTYKLFVAYAVFKEVEAGRMNWGDSFAGRTVEGCFDAMIVRSDNPCAKAFGDRLGWQNIENQMRSLGLSQTELSPALYTTARDLSLFLYKLENGSLVSAADRSRLIEAMKRQIYRAGIPAGTGRSVANKPGFIDSYIHDAGIVYGARGAYALTIMTSGSSWSSIASAAKQINDFLNR